MKCCRSYDHFNCWVTDYSVTRISSSSIIGGLVGGGLTTVNQADVCAIMYCEFSLYLQTRSSYLHLSGNPQKLIDQFTDLSRNISLTESDISIHLGKAWTAMYRLSIIFLISVVMLLLLYGCTTWTNNVPGEKTAAVWPLPLYLLNYPSETSKICWALLQKL